MPGFKSVLSLASMAAAVLASPIGSLPDVESSFNQLGSRKCGGVVCAADEYCCNPTCSMCAKHGSHCIMRDCSHLDTPAQQPDSSAASTVLPLPPRPTRTLRPSAGSTTNKPVPATQLPYTPSTTVCGKNICNAASYCCNESCGICAPPGGACIQLFCTNGELPDGSN